MKDISYNGHNKKDKMIYKTPYRNLKTEQHGPH